MNWISIKFIQDDRETEKFPSKYVLADEENDKHRSSFKVKSLFQIMYYHATHGKHKTKTHVMNAHAIYEKYKSRELIAAFNKQYMWISYKSIKSQWSNLA